LMVMGVLKEIFGVVKPIIGMIHLKPLPGTPGSTSLEDVLESALRDAENLVRGGVDGLLIENFFDSPFYPERVPPHIISSMTVIAWEIRKRYDLPIGVNVLRNDSEASLAIASAIGARFIRVNVYIGCVVTDQGLIQGRAHQTIRYRELLGSDVKIFADVNVKHGYTLYRVPLPQASRDTYYRGRADALILTGPETGAEASVDDLKIVREALPDAPILVGSGVNPDNVEAMLRYADGAIVGTYFKRDGVISNPVDPTRVKKLMEIVKEIRQACGR